MIPKKYIILSEGSPFSKTGDTIWGYCSSKVLAETLCEKCDGVSKEGYYFEEIDESSSIYSVVSCLDHLINFIMKE